MNIQRMMVVGETSLSLVDNNFDVDLQSFYKRVIERDIDVDDPRVARRVRRALKEVVSAYKRQTVESLTSSILFDSPETRCAYVLKHCACFTSALARHFRKFISSEAGHEVFQRRLHLNLCCVGGGPATDAVAVAKVIVSASSSGFDTTRMTLNVTVLDLSAGWRYTAEDVIRVLEEECLGRLRLSLEFLQVDLTEQGWPTPVAEALAEADIVTMSYFVSAVNGSPRAVLSGLMLERIMRTSKPGCVLFFMDSSKDVHYDTFVQAAHSVGSLQRVYGPCVNEFHALSMDSIREFLDVYSGRFDVFMCLTNCFVTCAAWMKRAERVCRARGSHQRPPCDACGVGVAAASNAARKRFAYNTVRQAAFRQRLERAFRPDSGFGGDDDHDQDSSDEGLDDTDWTWLDWRLLERLDSSRRGKRRRVKLAQHQRLVLVRTGDDSVYEALTDEFHCRRSDEGCRELGGGDRCFSEKMSSLTKWTLKKAVKEVWL